MRGMGGEVLEGDNLDVLDALLADAEVAGHVALVYLDPPFGTGRDFGAYDDRWEGGRHGLVEALRPRLERCHRLLAGDGSLLVHLDHRIAHLVAVLLDELFGPGAREPRKGEPIAGFRNELIWTYGLGGSTATTYPRKHDTLLWYSKGATWTFAAPRMPARSMRMRGKTKKQLDVFLGPPRLDDLDTPTAIEDAASSSGLGDVWDVASLNNMAKERTGYPTQKPLALLEPLVRAHSREGELVVDPFCGSGTSLVAAVRAGRRAIGIDVSAEAVRVARGRLVRKG